MTSIVGKSYWTKQIRETIARIAPHTSSVLVTGPSGTGKELIARSIHDQSPRATGPFIPVDCASVPGSLFSAQLFGHVKGAFTGAVGSSLGMFRAANGGTIFLDEVGELDLELQSNLLRVIQQRQVTPVGSHDSEPIDVRIIAATNRDLAAEVKAGRFRMDLFYRLDVISVDMKALKDRRDDILPLANHFIEQFADERGLPAKHLSPAAIQAVKSCDWPGNVRQLQNIIERSIVMSEGQEIGPEFIPQSTQGVELLNEETLDFAAADGDLEPHHLSTNVDGYPSDWPTLEENEREHLARTLDLTGYNQSAAARLLKIDYRLLMRRMKKYGLKRRTPSRSNAAGVSPRRRIAK